MRIGIIKEGKIPQDIRVALNPKHCKAIIQKYPDTQVFIEPSNTRAFTDEEYKNEQIPLINNLTDCDILFGVKEVPIPNLIPNKTYFFFSHTKKKQAYNQDLMQALIEKNIRMIDYESLTFENGKRILGFGFYAGVVGAHNALLTYGKKYKNFSLKPAHQCKDMAEMEAQYENIQFPNIKIIITGEGRVGQGILHTLNNMKIQEVGHEDFLNKEFKFPVFTLLKNEDLYRNKETLTYDKSEFYAHPEKYECMLQPFLKADILINGIYWDNNIPRLFEEEEVKHNYFQLKVIADITCDIDGSIPITLKATTIPNPAYGYIRTTKEKVAPYLNDDNIVDIMSVDNLPNELPRDASNNFGNLILEFIIPELFKAHSEILDRATICNNGKLGKHFEYLEDYAFPIKA
ncbi:MAG TPA: NAD(P)-dependent oxidoreductase [Edaphocola sp.]|nr:NAD(P)-dependent oxidoreductase [Edaphocola sp.]